MSVSIYPSVFLSTYQPIYQDGFDPAPGRFQGGSRTVVNRTQDGRQRSQKQFQTVAKVFRDHGWSSALRRRLPRTPSTSGQPLHWTVLNRVGASGHGSSARVHNGLNTTPTRCQLAS